MRSEDRSLFNMTPGMRLAIFLGTTGISMILGAFITFSIVAGYFHVGFAETQRVLLQPQNAPISLFANALASAIAFLIPSFAVAFFTKGSIPSNMGFSTISNPRQIQWVILLAFSGLLLSGALASLTELIPVPSTFKAWADGLEASYKKALMAMTQMHSIGDLFLNLLAVALIPAVVEELYFRGALQTTLKKWSGNAIIAIIITSIVFSAFHFSYFGFLSRMGLGIVLGFIFEYSKSIWLAMLLHFINNGVAIIALYLVRAEPTKVDKVMDENLPLYWGVVAVALVVFLLTKLKNDANYIKHEQLEKDILE
jgi:membrane protease YdiL (CAAX protease family)